MLVEDTDTDTLLAILSSVLPSLQFHQDDLLNALVDSDGDIQEAARRLTQQSKPSSVNSDMKRGQKRSRGSALDHWLNKNASSAPKPKSARKEESSVEDVGPSGTSSFRAPTSPDQSPAKPVVDLMSVLRQPPSVAQKVPRLPSLVLSNPSLVAQHTSCTLHLSVLPPELACKLFYTMVDASRDWQRNKWWLFDRLVESPHRTSFFARKTDGINDNHSWQEAAQYWYNGRKTSPPSVFPPEMEEACDIIEHVVNTEIRKRKRFPLEWSGLGSEGQIWRANVAASNCYEGAKEGVGFHSDQMTYLGPCPTIASLSLGTRRNFCLQEVIPSARTGMRRAQKFLIPLPHNSIIIMHPPTQEKFKHSIPPQPTIDLFHPPFPRAPSSAITPSNIRINITFRFYRPDFAPSTTPRCPCGVPMVLRAGMKGRTGDDGENVKYWWSCCAGAQNEGNGCDYWKMMDIEGEGRGNASMKVDTLDKDN